MNTTTSKLPIEGVSSSAQCSPKHGNRRLIQFLKKIFKMCICTCMQKGSASPQFGILWATGEAAKRCTSLDKSQNLTRRKQHLCLRKQTSHALSNIISQDLQWYRENSTSYQKCKPPSYHIHTRIDHIKRQTTAWMN